MPRYYCDYCDTYLTHDSPSVRKQHNAGYKHKANVRNYYQQYEAQLNQSLIDQKVKEHLGAFRPPVAPYVRPGLPVLHASIPGQLPAGMAFRLPVLPRPMPGAPGYALLPMPPPMAPPPGAPITGQMNGVQIPVNAPPPLIPGSAGIPTTSAPPMFPPPPYQGTVSLPTSGAGEGANANAQAPEANQLQMGVDHLLWHLQMLLGIYRYFSQTSSHYIFRVESQSWLSAGGETDRGVPDMLWPLLFQVREFLTGLCASAVLNHDWDSILEDINTCEKVYEEYLQMPS